MAETRKKRDNVPFLPSDEGSPMLLKTGIVNLYLTELSSDALSVGRRAFLTQCGEGDVVFPIPSAVSDGKRFVLLAVPMRECEFVPMPIEHAGVEPLRKWIASAGEAIAMRKAEIDRLCASLTAEDVRAFNDSFLLRAVETVHENERKVREANRNRHVNEEDYMRGSMETLQRIFENKKKQRKSTASTGAGAQSSANPLYNACAAVAGAMKIDLRVPFVLRNGLPCDNLLNEIAKASRLRIREVLLKDGWYRNPSGPLLAYRKGSKAPVALLPSGSHTYEWFDPILRTTEKVSEASAGQFEDVAVMFYRNLPMRTLSAKDIVRFTLSGTSAADWIWILVMGIGGGLLSMLVPEITGKVFDTIIPDGNRSLMIQIGFLLAAIALTTFAFDLTRSFAMQRIEGATERDLQSAVWDRLLSLPVGFFKGYSAGELAECAMSISTIRKVLSGSVVNTLLSGIFSLFYLFVLFQKGKQLAWIGLLVLFLITAVSLLVGFVQIKHEKKLLEQNNEISGKMFGWLSGVAKIKMAAAERRVFSNWTNLFAKSRAITFHKQHISGGMEIFHATTEVVLSLILYLAIFRLKDFTIAAGTFIAFNVALEKLLSSSLQITQAVVEANVVVPLYDMVRPILQAVPEYDEDKSDPGKLNGDIELSHINFRYDREGPLVIDDVSLSIKSGEHIALVGPSGSGKTTLFRVLLGFEKPENGQIFFDGKSLDQLDIRAVRRQLGVVLQSGQLLFGSIFENIVGANPSLTEADVLRAVKQAGMEEDLADMPMGLHTFISEGASTLSGGQRQRLLIARALASNPSILFLDEATSALDNNTQRIVSDSIGKLDATRITIAHRLSTVADCDRIVVLEHGKITEQGTYDELMALGGTFAAMASRQIA